MAGEISMRGMRKAPPPSTGPLHHQQEQQQHIADESRYRQQFFPEGSKNQNGYNHHSASMIAKRKSPHPRYHQWPSRESPYRIREEQLEELVALETKIEFQIEKLESQTVTTIASTITSLSSATTTTTTACDDQPVRPRSTRRVHPSKRRQTDDDEVVMMPPRRSSHLPKKQSPIQAVLLDSYHVDYTAPMRLTSVAKVSYSNVPSVHQLDHDCVCGICFDPFRQPTTTTRKEDPEVIQLNSCGHYFHAACFDSLHARAGENSDFQGCSRRRCPACDEPFVAPQGFGPSGRMIVERFGWSSSDSSRQGVVGGGLIRMTYQIPDGYQTNYHQFPFQPYEGLTKVAYLPDTLPGKSLLERFQYAFEHGISHEIVESQWSYEQRQQLKRQSSAGESCQTILLPDDQCTKKPQKKAPPPTTMMKKMDPKSGRNLLLPPVEGLNMTTLSIQEKKQEQVVGMNQNYRSHAKCGLESLFIYDPSDPKLQDPQYFRDCHDQLEQCIQNFIPK